MSIEYMKNGKWETLIEKEGIEDLTFNKIPYLGNGTKWKYFIVSSVILSSCTIFRISTKDWKKLKYRVLTIKSLEILKEKEGALEELKCALQNHLEEGTHGAYSTMVGFKAHKFYLDKRIKELEKGVGGFL